jgi:ribonuclease G
MPRNQIVINVDIGETRVALIENGIVTELHVERRGERSVVGDVYLGKVTRVLPGMNAAFVDIGLERAAFLHFDDIVSEGDLRAVVPEEEDDHPAVPAASAASADDEEEDAAVDGDAPLAAVEGDLPGADDEGEGDATLADLIEDTDTGAASATGAAPEAGNGNGNGSSARRSKDRGKDRRRGRKDVRGGRGERSAKKEHRVPAARVPPRELLREGQDIVVQVNKGPISTKGARVTSHISLPGRYVVYMPTVEHIGVSKRIGNDKERKRLREVIEQLKPEKGGLIVRTASEGLTKKQLKNDVGYLVQTWGDIWRKREQSRAPTLLASELDVVLRTVRDVMGPDIEKIVIDDKEAHARLVRFVEQFMPDRKDDVLLYTGSEPIFDEYGIEDEIARALARKVPLKSGGYLIIDQAEALTAIDVNSGRFVGKKDVEETVTQTNLEAVDEIAYQLRLRNLGGLIILDLIDMDRQSNRDKVYRALADALKHDKAKTSILRISELGLVEMTRKRTRESLGRELHEPCFYCDGTGHVQSKLTIAYEILRQIRRERDQLKGYTVVVNAHPAVADTLKHEAREVLEEAQRRYVRRIVVHAKPEYHIEQFDLLGQ